MMKSLALESHKHIIQQLKKATIALAAIVATQVIALEVVLRGWQSGNAVEVFSAIGVSAFLFVLSVIIFLRTRRNKGFFHLDKSL